MFVTPGGSEWRLDMYSEFEESFTPKPLFRISSNVRVKKWERLFLSKTPKLYKKGSVIISQGEENNNVFYLLNGLIEYTYTDKTGAENILEILGAGCILNLQPVFGKNPSIAAFTALSDCRITAIPGDEIWSLMAKDAKLVEEMLEEMAVIIGGLNRQLCISTENSYNRTLQIIYMLAANKLEETPNAAVISLRLSQGDLARITRTTRVTITKILSDLKQKGIVETDYGGIYVKNMSALTHMAQNKKY
jgi:CRP-like cAMP-binding protein